MKSKKNKSHFQVCLLGGTIGDALGWPVEFKSYSEIMKIFGVKGIRDFDTDDRNGMTRISLSRNQRKMKECI